MDGGGTPLFVWLVMAYISVALFIWFLPWSAVALGVVLLGLLAMTLFDEWQLDEAMREECERLATIGRERVRDRFEITRDLLRRNFDDSVRRMDELVAEQEVGDLLLSALDEPGPVVEQERRQSPETSSAYEDDPLLRVAAELELELGAASPTPAHVPDEDDPIAKFRQVLTGWTAEPPQDTP